MHNTIHNPYEEIYRVSCLRENLTSISDGEGLETGRVITQVPRQSLTRQVFFKQAKQQLGLAREFQKLSKLITEIEPLSVKERTWVADSILQSLTPIDSKKEEQWVKVAIKRLKEIQTGKVKAIPGVQVFNKIQNRFTK